MSVAVTGLALVALTEAGFAAWLKPTLDSLFVEPDPERARLVPLWLIGIFLVRGVARFAATYGMAWVGRRVIRQLRTELFDQLLVLPIRFVWSNKRYLKAPAPIGQGPYLLGCCNNMF